MKTYTYFRESAVKSTTTFKNNYNNLKILLSQL